MARKARQVTTKDKLGKSSISKTQEITTLESSPLLVNPEQLKMLTQYKSDIVEVIVNEALNNNDFSRKQSEKINNFIHKERMRSINFSFILSFIGIVGGIFLAWKVTPYCIILSIVSVGGVLLPHIKKRKEINSNN